MRLRKIKIIFSAIILSVFVGRTEVKAAYIVVDIAQDALAVTENLGVIDQFMQLFQIGDVTRQIYSVQGDFRNLKSRLNTFLNFDWTFDSTRRKLFNNVMGEVNSFLGPIDVSINNLQNIRLQAEKALSVPINAAALKEITAEELLKIKSNQRAALRSSALRGYSLGLGLQADFSRFEADVIPALRGLSSSATSLTELTAAQTEGLNLIASEINTGNLLKASALELLSADALKTMDIQLNDEETTSEETQNAP